MMIHELVFDKVFKKDLSNIDKEMRNRILKKIFELEKYPELGKHLIGTDIWSLITLLQLDELFIASQPIRDQV